MTFSCADTLVHRVTTYRIWLLIISLLLLLSGCGPEPLKTGSLTTNPQQPIRVPATSTAPPNVIPTSVVATSEANNPTPPEQVPTEAIPTSVPIVEPTIAVATIPVVQPSSGEVAWNNQKVDVSVFEQPRTFTAPGNVMLQWYDPSTGQFVGLGWVSQPLVATSEFRLRWSGIRALAIPYKINSDYGLILDDSMIARIRKSYSGDTIEAFVWYAPDFVQN